MRARAARRPKSVVTTLKSGPVIALIAAFVLLGLAALGRIWHEHRNTLLTKEISGLRAKVRLLTRDIQEMRVRQGQLTSPHWIEAQLRKHKLDLVAPSEGQFLRVVEPRWGELEAADSSTRPVRQVPPLADHQEPGSALARSASSAGGGP